MCGPSLVCVCRGGLFEDPRFSIRSIRGLTRAWDRSEDVFGFPCRTDTYSILSMCPTGNGDFLLQTKALLLSILHSIISTTAVLYRDTIHKEIMDMVVRRDREEGNESESEASSLVNES